MKKISFLLVLLIFVISCSRKTSIDATKSKLQSEISLFKQNNNCASAKIMEYTFQSKLVYVLDPGKCGADMTSNVIDENGKSLGFLGGFTGNTVINGADFSEAKLLRTVWEKTDSAQQ